MSASITDQMAWPYYADLAARAAGLAAVGTEDAEKLFAQAVVLTIAAEEGRIEDSWLRERLLWFATDVVPGLMDDLREARIMAARLDPAALAGHLGSTTHWPGAPARVLKALVALRPEFADVIRQRALVVLWWVVSLAFGWSAQR